MAIKKISEFTSGTPTSADRILFEQSSAGKNATIESVGKAIGINLDLLWNNTSPGNLFVGKKINLDLSNYKIILIGFYDTVNLRMVSTHISFKNETGHMITLFTPVSLLVRTITVDNTGVTFGDGRSYRAYNNEETGVDESNNYMIPYRIYGVK